MATQGSDSSGPDDVPEWATTDPDPDDEPNPDREPSAYVGKEVLPPPAFSSGRYQFAGRQAPTRPPDPVVPFVAPPVPRRRRSDWPVLVVALVVSAFILAACCIAGYVLYASKGAPTF